MDAGAGRDVLQRQTRQHARQLLAAGIVATTVYSPATLGSRYCYVVSAIYGGSESENSIEGCLTLTPTAWRSDADGNAKSAIMVHRPTTGNWYLRYSGAGYAVGAGNWNFQCGLVGDSALPTN